MIQVGVMRASILTRVFRGWTSPHTVLKRPRNIRVWEEPAGKMRRQRDRERIETRNVTVVVVILLSRVVLDSALNAATKDKRNEDE